jgi:hypothetical protein
MNPSRKIFIAARQLYKHYARFDPAKLPSGDMLHASHGKLTLFSFPSLSLSAPRQPDGAVLVATEYPTALAVVHVVLAWITFQAVHVVVCDAGTLGGVLRQPADVVLIGLTWITLRDKRQFGSLFVRMQPRQEAAELGYDAGGVRDAVPESGSTAFAHDPAVDYRDTAVVMYAVDFVEL